jgi:diaminopimelate decarboxylase
MIGDLASRYGTPLYVYDLAVIRQARRDLAGGLPVGSRVLNSLKANPLPAVVAELARMGCGADVSSPRELDIALAAGIVPPDVLYTGPAKTAQEVSHALARDVRLFSAESPTDLALLSRCARAAGTRARALLRLNPSAYPTGAGLPMGGLPSQFGSDVAWVRAQPGSFAAPSVRVVGAHIYTGTGAADVGTLLSWMASGLEAAREAADALGLTWEVIDLGGGFGHPFVTSGRRPDLAGLGAGLTRLIEQAFPPPYRPECVFESGRYLAAGAGQLVLRVQDIKESKGERFVLVDGGVNVIGGLSALRRVPPITAEAIPVSPGAGRTETESAARSPGLVRLVGPLCTTVDVLHRNMNVGQLAVGDLLVVPNAGAYGLTASLVAFLGRVAPAEVCIDGSRVVSATRLEYGYRELRAGASAAAAGAFPSGQHDNGASGDDHAQAARALS